MINFTELKRIFLFVLIGSLIISASVAIIIVLTGTMNEITAKVLWTLGTVAIHSLAILAVTWDEKHQSEWERLAFFANVLFLLIGASFITSTLAIWEIFPGETMRHLYQSYFVLGLAALHGNALHKVLKRKRYIDNIIYANYIFIGIVVIMLQPFIFTNYNRTGVLGKMFPRVLAASGIVDGTLSVLVTIFYKLYLQQHPEEKDALIITGREEKGGIIGSFVRIIAYTLLGIIILALLILILSRI